MYNLQPSTVRTLTVNLSSCYHYQCHTDRTINSPLITLIIAELVALIANKTSTSHDTFQKHQLIVTIIGLMIPELVVNNHDFHEPVARPLLLVAGVGLPCI
jgi:hypothetical protein